MDLVAQAALRPNAHAVADDQHADHQLWINRWPSHHAVKWPQVLANAGQVDKPIDRTKNMVRRNVPLHAELIKQWLLCHRTLSHPLKVS
jgi:hypothetical protein